MHKIINNYKYSDSAAEHTISVVSNSASGLKASSFKAKFLEDGIVQYDDEILLLKQDVLKALIPSFQGVPIIIEHQNVTLENIKALAVGYAHNVYIGDDGKAYVEFTTNDAEAKSLIENGTYVSCTYNAEQAENTGTFHNIEYQKEITGGYGLHIAIVDNPRYEDAVIIPNSVKPKNNKIMKNIFKFGKVEKKVDEKVTELELDNSIVEFEKDGITTRKKMSELLNADDTEDKPAKKENEEEKEEDKKENEEEDKKEDKKENAIEVVKSELDVLDNSIKQAENGIPTIGGTSSIQGFKLGQTIC